MPDLFQVVLAAILLVALIFVTVRIATLTRLVQQLSSQTAEALEQKHRAMLGDLHGGLAQQSDRLTARMSEELNQTREALHRLQLSLTTNLGDTTDKINARIDERLDQIAGRVSERL